MSTNNIINNYTAAPSFCANIDASSVSPVSGDGTLYTPIFDNVSSNIGSGYNASTGIFTVSVPGYYIFTYAITSEVQTSGGTYAYCYLQINSLKQALITYPTRNRLANFFADGTNYISHSDSIIVQVAVGDTVNVVFCSAGGTKVDGIAGHVGGAWYSTFNGSKLF